MQRKTKIFLLASVLILCSIVILKLAAHASRTTTPSEVLSQVGKFIETQHGLNTDQKLALMRYAQFLQNIIDDKKFDELKEISCIDHLSGPYEKAFKDLKLVIKGKVLNSAVKIRKYYNHEEQFDGQVITFPKVTREDCVR